MHSFADPFGVELEKHLLSRLDFPIYLALACYLIHRICNENVWFIDKIEL